jgi:hypothetical protein
MTAAAAHGIRPVCSMSGRTMNTPWTPPPRDGGPGALPLAAPPAKIRPGRIWYLVGLLVFLGGVAWLVVGIVSVFSHVNSFPRVAVPAGGQVSLDHSGGYVIYYEVPTGRSVLIPQVQVRVAAASADAALGPMAPYNGSLSYSNGSRQGYAILTLQVIQPGRFTVTTPGQTDLPPGSDLAFGDSFGRGLAVSIGGGVLLILAGLGGLIAIFIIRIVKTNRARSPVPAWSAPAGPSTPPPPIPPPSQQPPPQP